MEYKIPKNRCKISDKKFANNDIITELYKRFSIG